MGLLEKVKFTWDSLGMIVSLIKKWRPKDCKTEKSYEKSLYDYLHDKMKDIQVTRQYAKGRIRADLVVGDKVIIELNVRYISVVYTFGRPYHVNKTGGSHGDTQENKINSSTKKRHM